MSDVVDKETEREESARKATAKGKKKRNEKSPFERLARLANFHAWSLKARFVHFTGLLLLLGNLTLIVFFYSIQNDNLENLCRDRLRFLRTWVETELGQQRRFLMTQALSLASIPTVGESLAANSPEALKAFLLPYCEKILLGSGESSLRFGFFTPSGEPFPHNDPGAEAACAEPAKALAAKAVSTRKQASGMAAGPAGLLLGAAVPVFSRDKPVGIVTALASLPDLIRNLDLPREYDLTLLLAEAPEPDAKSEAAPARWRIWKEFGDAEMTEARAAVLWTEKPFRDGSFHLAYLPLADLSGREAAGLILSFDASWLRQHLWNTVALFALFFSSGAFILWLTLYLNTARIVSFLARLKKIIIASHSNYFAERFEADHVHCLDILHCHNEECPVYQNPSMVCYLETGSEAISPKWRDSCIYLNKYQFCKNCPVYSMRKGDELTEMRNVVNTMMRHWSQFLSRIGHLLTYVLRSQGRGAESPSLDEISDRLEQMAKLTFFNHDLQGVLGRDEVYRQLAHVAREQFGLRRFVIFEVNQDAETMAPALDAAENEPLCRKALALSSEACRAKRMAEEATSFFNPVLCPHFNCDTDKETRCCLPLVMGGAVGGVFSFVIGKRDWERVRRQMPVIRKYLDESAPVLSSLSLLQLTKEQTLRDPLTQCHNRRFLDEFIAKYEPLTEREGGRTGFVMADLDFFKQVNDQYGHQAGDAVLTQAARIMRNRVRRSDLLIRYGGEEFLILLQNVQDNAAYKVAETIREAIANHEFDIGDGRKIKKTISLGVAEHPTDAKGLYQSIKFADVALYEAKRQGRNKVVRFEAGMWSEDSY